MLGEAFDFPTSGSRGARSVLIGGALVLVSVALLNGGLFFIDLGAPLRPQAALFGVVALSIVPVVLLRGYHLRVFRRVTTHTEPEAPGFGGVAGLVGDGLRSVFVALAYALPVAVFGGLAAAGQFTARLGLPATAEATLRNVAGVSLVLALFSVLAMAYLLPAALAMLAYHENVGAAFRLRELVSGTLTEDYAVGWVGALLVQTVAFPVAVLLRGLLVGFFLQFLVAVAVRFVWARSAADGLGLEPTVEPEPEYVPEPIPAIRRVEPVPAVRRVDPVPAIRRAEDETTADSIENISIWVPGPDPVVPPIAFREFEPAIRRVEDASDPGISPAEPTDKPPAGGSVESSIRPITPEPAIRRVAATTDGTGPTADESEAVTEETEDETTDDTSVESTDDADETVTDDTTDAPKQDPTTIDEWEFGEDRGA